VAGFADEDIEDSLVSTVIASSVNSDKDPDLWAKPFDGSESLGDAGMSSPRNRAPSVVRQCAVCMDNMDKDAGELDGCGHTFCFECIEQWSNVTNKCPLCKCVFEAINREGGASKKVEDRLQVATASGMQSITVAEATDIGDRLDRSLAAMENMILDSRSKKPLKPLKKKTQTKRR